MHRQELSQDLSSFVRPKKPLTPTARMITNKFSKLLYSERSNHPSKSLEEIKKELIKEIENCYSILINEKKCVFRAGLAGFFTDSNFPDKSVILNICLKAIKKYKPHPDYYDLNIQHIKTAALKLIIQECNTLFVKQVNQTKRIEIDVTIKTISDKITAYYNDPSKDADLSPQIINYFKRYKPSDQAYALCLQALNGLSKYYSNKFENFKKHLVFFQPPQHRQRTFIPYHLPVQIPYLPQNTNASSHQSMGNSLEVMDAIVLDFRSDDQEKNVENVRQDNALKHTRLITLNNQDADPSSKRLKY